MPLVGASGIAIGLLIALTTVSPDSKMFPLPVRARNLRNGIILGTVILLLMIPVSAFLFLEASANGFPRTEGAAFFLSDMPVTWVEQW